MRMFRISTAAGFLLFLALGSADAEDYGAVSTLPALDAGIAQRRAVIDTYRGEDCSSVGKLLALMFDVDQFARFSVFAICPSSSDWKCVSDPAERVLSVDAANLKILKPIVARYSWHQLGMCGGKDTQHDVWLLVQHADQDKAFQHAVLRKMREAFLAYEVSATDYAYLVDRVALGANKPQIFGTQGHCDGQKWILFPVVRPEGLDRRRHEMRMEPEAELSPRAEIFCK